MKLPPFFLRVRIAGARNRWPTLWLPLFLLWPLLFALLFALSLPAFVLVCICAPRAIRPVLALPSALYTFLCSLRGTLVDVAGEPRHVLIAFD